MLRRIVTKCRVSDTNNGAYCFGGGVQRAGLSAGPLSR
jgi:hypothetical protein